MRRVQRSGISISKSNSIIWNCLSISQGVQVLAQWHVHGRPATLVHQLEPGNGPAAEEIHHRARCSAILSPFYWRHHDPQRDAGQVRNGNLIWYEFNYKRICIQRPNDPRASCISRKEPAPLHETVLSPPRLLSPTWWPSWQSVLFRNEKRSAHHCNMSKSGTKLIRFGVDFLKLNF